MKNRTFVLGAVVISLIVATAVAFIFLDRSAKGQQKPIKKYSELPKIISNVESLEIVKTNLKEEGTTDAFVEIKVRNNSYKPIIAINIESGDDKNASGKMTSGIIGDEKPPIIIIQPYETYQMHFPLSDVIPGFPIRIGGVIYADETEDGEESILKSMRRKIDHKKDLKKHKEDSSQ